jgi:hypothetical protein
VGQKEMYIKIQKVFSYEPVLLRWAMWPMGLLLYIYNLFENNQIKFNNQVEKQLAPHTSRH